MTSTPLGRPRSQKARRAVLDAACALFQEGGYPAATIEAIAARSGVAKTTIYRWWPTRAALVVELLLQLAAVAVPSPEDEDPMKALRKELRDAARASEALPAALLRVLVGEAQHDEQLRAALVQGLFDPRHAVTAGVIRRAQASGRLRRVAPRLAVDLFFGPLFYRGLVRHEPVSDRFVAQVYHHVLRGLGPAKPGRARKRRSVR